MKVITFEKMQEILETLIDKLNTINDKFASKESLKITDDTLKSLSDSYNEHGPHTGLSFDLPKPAENEAQAGVSDNAARADHIHPLQTSVQNAETATKLTKSIDITIGGNKKSFDGSNNISWTLDEMGAAKKEHTHDFSPSNHNHDNKYEKIGHNHDNRYEKIGHNHSYNDLTDLPDLSDIGGGLDITDTIILKSYESGKTFELNVTPTGNLVTKESSKSEYSEVILRDGDNNKFKLIINDKGTLSIESTTYENKFKDTYIQAQYPYAEIFRISVFTDNDGSVLMTSSLNKNFINDNGAYNNYTWSSIKILEEINKAKVDVSNKQDKTDNNLSTTNKTITGAINELKTKVDETFQSANNGKELIANAIGNSDITSNSTFSAMSDAIIDTRNAITDTRNRLYNLMVDGGYEVNSSMNLDSLLNLLELSGIGVNDIRQIAGGDEHTFILKTNGSLYSCGVNTYGQLGLEDTTDRKIFTKVTTNINNDVKQVACGASHTVILKNDGSVWSCGVNAQGQLGLGDTDRKNTFTQVTTNVNNDVKQVACGQNYTVILKNDGSVWSCGYNNYGQLGLVNTANKTTFTKVTTNANNVEQISCGYSHTFILKNDGTIWSCGYNGSGQLGLGNTTNKSTFTKVTTNVNNDVKQIVCSQNYTFILKTNGSVWGCGYNNYGQLGLGTIDTNYNTFTQATTNINNDVKQIACGDYHTLILKNDGSVWSCGRNDTGQLGLSGAGDKNTFTKVTTNINNDVKLIACGGYHSFILKKDGSVWSCGYNYHGQLGLDNSYETGGFTGYTDFTDILRGL